MKAYGPAVKLSSYDSSFKYGVTSKMFDGQMFCNGDYANARTQVKPIGQDSTDTNGGFGVLFSKESNDASYFMMNFKCSVVLADNQNLTGVRSSLNLKLGLFMRNETGYTYQPLTSPTTNNNQRLGMLVLRSSVRKIEAITVHIMSEVATSW